MSDQNKTEAELLEETARLRRRIGELEQQRDQIGDRNETILRTCIDGFWLIDLDGHILEVNDAYCHMSGYTRDELLTMSVQDVEAVETAKEITLHIREITARGAHRFESRQRCKDGTIIDLDISAHRLKSDAGKIFTFLRDVTAQKQAERALRESEARYRTLVERLPAITYIAALDEASTTLYISPQIESLIGFTPAEYKSDPDMWRERLHPDDRDRVLKAVSESHAEKKAFVQEYRMIGKDGRIVWFRDEGVVVKDENAQPLFLQGVMYDITEQKRAEEEIRKFKTLADKAGYGVAMSDLEGNLTYVNEAFAQMHGHRPEELIGRHFSICHNPEQMERLNQLHRRILEQGSLAAEELWHKRRDNTVFPTLMSATVIRDEKGEPLFMAATVTDITDLIQAEEALKYSQERFRLAMETTNDALWDWNMVTDEVYRNPRHDTMLGYEPGELSASQDEWDKRIHPDDRALVLGALEAHLAGKSDSFELEYRLRTKSGDYIWVLGRAKVVAYNADSSPARMIGTNIDITRRKKAERELRDSKDLLEKTFCGLDSAVFILDYERPPHIIDCNPAAPNIFGYAKSEMLGRTTHFLHVNEQTLLEFQQALYPAVKTQGHLSSFEFRMKRKDGRILPTEHGVFPLTNNEGEHTGWVSVVQDITERKKAEDALRISEEKYKTLVEISSDSICVIDEAGVFVFANRSTAQAIGARLEDVVGKTMWDLFPKDIADRRMADVWEVIKTQQSKSIIRLTELRGQILWYHTNLLPIRGGSGKTVVMGVARDIDELKRAEEKISTLSSAVEQSMDGVTMGDVESRFVYVNEAFARMHGYTREEMVGMKAADLYAQDQMERYEATFAQIRKGGSYTGEVRHTRKDGTDFPCHVSVTLVKNERGEVTGTVAVCRDMTESKRREEELTRYREQMARAEQLASLGTLSATVAHQITQPLTVIRLSLDNVLDELLGTSSSSTAIRRLQDSIGQVSNITAIINRFRHFARQSSDTRFGQVNLNVVAERVVRLLEESARQARVALRLKTVGNLPPVSMNETDLEQLFFALLENAIQASDGTKAREVVISGDVRNKQIELRFCDDCGGIAPENLQRLFEPFFTTRPRGQGTGLGLCIVHDVVTRAGGHVRAESEFGKGSTFFVTLPVSEGKTA